MGYTIPSLKEVWEMLPARAKVCLGWGLAFIAILALTGELVNRYSGAVLEHYSSWRDRTQESEFERAQREWDADHVGQSYRVLHSDQDARVLLYPSDRFLLVRREWDGVTTHLWVPHPEVFGAPPEIETAYGDDEHQEAGSSAGLIPMGGQACAPYSACLADPQRHPGAFTVVYQKRLEKCWLERHLRWPDGCVAGVPFNDCGNYYSWAQAAWLCCVPH